ncbi:MAG: protein-L-isoaspartate(D-aspartate) O-methyltransferase [Bacteroidia bacterium]
MTDSYKYVGRRKRLAQELEVKGISDKNVLEAIRNVPRHFFFDSDFIDQSYEDKAFPIGHEQTISQPFTVAFQTQLLALQPGMKVLEIGTGSGYQSAILAEMGVEVFSIERVRGLYEAASQILGKMKYRVHCFLGDGSLGLSKKGPFDGIIVTAASHSLAENLKEQLKPGGRLVIPVGDQSIQKMVLIEKSVENIYTRTEHGEFKFVPLLGKHGW